MSIFVCLTDLAWDWCYDVNVLCGLLRHKHPLTLTDRRRMWSARRLRKRRIRSDPLRARPNVPSELPYVCMYVCMYAIFIFEWFNRRNTEALYLLIIDLYWPVIISPSIYPRFFTYASDSSEYLYIFQMIDGGLPRSITIGQHTCNLLDSGSFVRWVILLTET